MSEPNKPHQEKGHEKMSPEMVPFLVPFFEVRLAFGKLWCATTCGEWIGSGGTTFFWELQRYVQQIFGVPPHNDFSTRSPTIKILPFLYHH